MNDMLKNMLVWVVIAVVIMSVFNNFVPQKNSSTNLSYSEFINEVKNNQIESVLIEADGKTISGTYKNGTKFLTYGLNDPKLVDDLLVNNIEILTEPPAKPSLLLQMPIQWFFSCEDDSNNTKSFYDVFSSSASSSFVGFLVLRWLRCHLVPFVGK